MKKNSAVIYYAYANSETREWFLFPTDKVTGENLTLLFVCACRYTAAKHHSPDPTQIAEGGIYSTADNCRVEILDRQWYGLKYQYN